ncbi:hypothetical protein KUV95_15675 [Microbulbifer agarilyticus]|uniref:hypothetical protein n=1 Tax=Microbulbifer agarilyticus TaxID=260552 RepID=UPI001C95899F|nr:hypothetical protein [Microbulbifer agarilyticus]MBY6212991.1 hypothetical protein [Microbulbifer agarilyticus]
MPFRLALPGVDFRRWILLAGIPLVLCICVAGCRSDNDNDNAPRPGEAPRATTTSATNTPTTTNANTSNTGEEKTGIFVGDIKGLFYETPSFSGLTDDKGQFRYRQGERIRFSLGGVDLGAALARPRMSPFNLAGTLPFTEEWEFRAALEDHQRVDALDLASNMILFLLILDRDQDPSNGIDLTDWNTDLRGYSVNFDFDLYAFPFRRGLDSLPAIKSQFEIRYQLPLDAPLLYLYDALGILIPTLVPFDETRDFNDDDIIEQRILWRYNDLGLPRDIRYSLFPDELDRWRERLEYTYDDWGRAIFVLRETDLEENGIVNFFYTSERFYNDEGFLIEIIEQDGRVLPEEQRRFVFAYDEGSNLDLYVFEQDFTVSGVVDAIFAIESLYDDDGLLRLRLEESDRNADGLVQRRLRYEYFYNDLAQPFEVLETEDDGVEFRADGVIDRRRQVLYVYGAGARLLRETVRFDDNDDGQVDRINTYEFLYESSGRLREESWAFDLDADGVVESRRTFTYRYSTDDLLLRVEMDLDNDDNGFPEATTVTNYRYNTRGQLRETEIATFNGNDEQQSLLTTTRIYGARGQLVDWYREGEGFTGVTNTPTRLRFRYREIDNGLRYLIDHYRYRQPQFTEVGNPAINVPCIDYRFAEGEVRCGLSWPMQWKLFWEETWKAPGINRGGPVVIRP